jgi:hypothetical protein
MVQASLGINQDLISKKKNNNKKGWWSGSVVEHLLS